VWGVCVCVCVGERVCVCVCVWCVFMRVCARRADIYLLFACLSSSSVYTVGSMKNWRGCGKEVVMAQFTSRSGKKLRKCFGWFSLSPGRSTNTEQDC